MKKCTLSVKNLFDFNFVSFKVPPACFMIPLNIEEGKEGMSEKILNCTKKVLK